VRKILSPLHNMLYSQYPEGIISEDDLRMMSNQNLEIGADTDGQEDVVDTTALHERCRENLKEIGVIDFE